MSTDKSILLKKKSCLDLQAAKKLINIAQSADSRGIDFCMTFTEIKRLLSIKKCYFTGVVLNNICNHPSQLTFDRVDNEKGYVNGNVVVCSKEFNNVKADLTVNQVRLIVKAFKKKKIW